MSEHSPAPWRYKPVCPEDHPDRFSPAVIYDANGAPVGSFFLMSGDIMLDEANVRLTATAPELLEFAMEFEKGPDEDGKAIDFQGLIDWINILGAKARSAIAKATE